MKKSLHFGVCTAILAASIAGPILTWRHAQAALLDQSERLRQQEMEIAALTREHRYPTNTAPVDKAALREEQLRELLKLRAEAAALRRQTNDSAGLEPTNHRTDSETDRPAGSVAPQSEDELTAELSNDILAAMKGMLKELPGALDRFAQEHSGKRAAQFSDLRKYFPKVDGKRIPGLYTFAFVREEGPQPGDLLILKEQSLRSHGDKASKIYGFSNGQVTEITFPEDENTQRSFARWESQYLKPLPHSADAAQEER